MCRWGSSCCWSGVRTRRGHHRDRDERGNILLQSSRDVLIDAPIISQTGHIHIDASDDVLVGANVAAGQNLWIQAANNKASDQPPPLVDGINIQSQLLAANSVLLQTTGSILVAGDITSQTGGIGVSARQSIDQRANAIASLGSLIIAAEVGNYTMSANASNTSQLAMISTGGTISLGSIQSATIHMTAGGDILDATQSSNRINLTGTDLTCLLLAPSANPTQAMFRTPTSWRSTYKYPKWLARVIGFTSRQSNRSRLTESLQLLRRSSLLACYLPWNPTGSTSVVAVGFGSKRSDCRWTRQACRDDGLDCGQRW